jgi:4-hydroxy-tetrahydrodipicolinate synthase
MPALVTPMLEDGSLDLPALRDLIDWHIAEGTDGLVVVGTSGESPTVSVDEHILLIKTAVEHTAKRIPVIAGAGGNSTAEAIELTEQAKRVGADACLQVVPYYNKPTQEGLFRHFSKIAESVDLPVILYNVPGRTVADMGHETVLRLAQVPGIVGVKEATGNVDRAAHLIKAAPAGFSIFSGDDPTAIALMLLGGHGNISVTANVAPRAMSELCKAAMAGDALTARALHMKLLALHKYLFIESNPIPVKWVLQQMGKMQGGIRLPLTPLDAKYHELVRAALREAELLS